MLCSYETIFDTVRHDSLLAAHRKIIAVRTVAAQTTGDKRMIHLTFDVPVHHNL